MCVEYRASSSSSKSGGSQSLCTRVNKKKFLFQLEWLGHRRAKRGFGLHQIIMSLVDGAVAAAVAVYFVSHFHIFSPLFFLTHFLIRLLSSCFGGIEKRRSERNTFILIKNTSWGSSSPRSFVLPGSPFLLIFLIYFFLLFSLLLSLSLSLSFLKPLLLTCFIFNYHLLPLLFSGPKTKEDRAVADRLILLYSIFRLSSPASEPLLVLLQPSPPAFLFFPPVIGFISVCAAKRWIIAT